VQVEALYRPELQVVLPALRKIGRLIKAAEAQQWAVEPLIIIIIIIIANYMKLSTTLY
jgi:hypothetical protein